MPDANTVEITQDDLATASGKKKKKRSLLRDPFSRFVLLLIALVVIGALVTALIAITNGTIRLEGGPQNLAQALEARAKGSIKEDGSAEAYADLIVTQVDQGDIVGAQATLNEARGKKLDVTRSQAIDFADAYILQNSGQLNKAIKLYEGVMNKLLTAYKNEKANGGDMNWALSYGIPDNYYNSAWQLADIYAKDGNEKEALKFISTYLKGNETDAQALTDRGNLYLKLGEKNKAKTDFQKALKYIPDSADASAGLKKAEGK